MSWRFTCGVFCILAGVWAAAWTAVGQDTPPVSVRAAGMVRTASGTPVPGATVRILHTPTGKLWVTWTDDSGKFELPGLPEGQFRIEAQQLGFATTAVEASLTAEKSTGIDLKLRIAAFDTPVDEVEKLAPTAAAASTAAPSPEVAKPEAARPTGTPSDAPSAPGETPPRTGKSSPPRGTGRPGTSQRGAQGQPLPANMAELIQQRMRQGGFQQVDPTGQGSVGISDGGVSSLPDNPLGEAASSDAFLISGTVGRGVTPSGENPFGAFGGIGGIGGFPGFGDPGGFGPGGVPGQGGGMPGGMGQIFVQMMGGPGGQQGGRGQSQGQRQGQGQGQRQGQQRAGQGAQGGQGNQGSGSGAPASQPVVISGGGPGGVEALWGMQRILRQQVNRVRFGFYERFGHSAFDARPYSLTEVNPAKIDTWRQRFGANIGGPLVLGKLYNGRDKTFFFANYDMARTRDPVDVFATVPLEEERRGDFTARGAQLFDPLSSSSGPRAAFASAIPPGRLNSAALGLLEVIPLPNLPGLVQNFHLQTRVPTSTNRFNVRLVHTVSPKLNFQATYNLSQTQNKAIQSFPQLFSRTSTRGQNVMLGLTQTLTRRLINDSRLMFNRNRSRSLNAFAFRRDVAGDLGITGISTAAINFGIPQLSLTNYNDLNDPVPALRRNQTLRLMDTISYSLSKHTLRGGLELRRFQYNTLTDPTPRGQFSFTGVMTSQLTPAGEPVTGTGWDFADFLLGFPQTTVQRFGSSSTYFRSWGFVTFFQDDWRLHPRFSITWGIRYELLSPPVEKFNRIANLDISPDFTDVVTVVPGQSGPFHGEFPRGLVHPDRNNWAPRFAIAWKPAAKGWFNKHPLTIRAGYSLFYNTSIYTQLMFGMANQPPFAQAQSRITNDLQLLTLQNGFPPVPQDTVRNTVAIDPNYRLGYAQIWNLSAELQAAPTLVSTLTYTGTKGTQLDRLRAPNRVSSGSIPGQISNALGFTLDTFGANSIYNALQLSVFKRMARGWMITGQYTYGKSIDDASTIGGGGQVVVQDDRNFRAERGRSSFDVRHQLRSNFFYELPFGERKKWARKGWTARTLGSLQMNGGMTISSGTPYTARILGGTPDNSGTGGFSQRADQVGNPDLPAADRSPLHFFNTSAFVEPPPGAFGNAARNTISGPGTFQVNFAVNRNIRFGRDGQRRMDVRWEVNN
ncbi:MAG: carboxypeptidase-like regulatory domain-containing protein, partial [Acidobacteria bacterium]|nr:carboxypeptidase-like regulatory domain-containing protein [Acidobacteriota bacterium]